MLKNKKGSALILLLMIVGALSILGVSLMNMTVSNFKLKKTNTLLKNNLYAAEAGLEEAYANIYVIIRDACDSANIEANKIIDNYSDQIQINNEEHIIKQASEAFEYEYKKYVQDEIEKLTDTSDLAKSSYSADLGVYMKKVDGSSLKGVKFDRDNKITIAAVSTYTHDNVKKQISSNIQIYMPKYEEPYTIIYGEKGTVSTRIQSNGLRSTVNIDYGRLLMFENWKVNSW